MKTPSMTRTRHGLSFESRYLWPRAAHITVFPPPPRSKYKLEACENAAYYMNVSWLLHLLVYAIVVVQAIVWTFRWRQGLVLGSAPVGEQACFNCSIFVFLLPQIACNQLAPLYERKPPTKNCPKPVLLVCYNR